MQHLLRVLHLQMSLSHKVLEVFILGDMDETKEWGQIVQDPYSKSSGFSQEKEVRWKRQSGGGKVPLILQGIWFFRQRSSGTHRREKGTGH